MWRPRGRAIVAAALATGLSLVGLAGCGGAHDGSGADHPSAGAPGPAAKLKNLDRHCPPVATPVAYPPGGKLPDPGKVVGVRMCNGEEAFTAPDGTAYEIAPPADEVTAGIGALVQIVNGSDPVTARKCFDDQGPNVVFWFRYADHTARAVVDQRYDCRPLLVGPGVTTNAGDALYLGFLKALAAQRAAHAKPKGSQPAPSCNVEQPTTPLDLTAGLDLSAAAICTDLGSGRTGQANFNASALAKVNQDFATSAAPASSAATSCTPGSPRWLVGTTVYGDHVLLKGVAGSCAFAVPNVVAQEVGSYWTPSAQVESLLERLSAPS